MSVFPDMELSLLAFFSSGSVASSPLQICAKLKWLPLRFVMQQKCVFSLQSKFAVIRKPLKCGHGHT